MSTLIEVSKRLQAERITSIVRTLREPNASVRRVILLVVYTALVYIVATRGAATGLQPEAQGALPVIATFLLVSAAWAAFLRFHPPVRERLWVDIAGSLGNFLGVALLLRVAWNVMLPFVATLPLSCITIGALHGRKAFFASILFSTLVVFSSAPSGYWMTRPFVGMLALALLVGLPLTVTRLMMGLREISVEAIKARDAQSRFLATMSHELRTPLSSVVAASEIFQTEERPERQRQLMQLLSVNALVLRNRVNDVLDVRSIEAGRLVFSTEPFTFGGLFKTVSYVVSPQARDKNVTLRFIAGPAKDIVLRSDPGRIEQMLTNLCTNAVKFTPAGGRIEVSVQAWPVEKNDKRMNVEVSVCDTGIGIPDDVKKKIFDPFYQVSAGVSRAAEGIGLGLFIVSSIAKMMGGAIDVHDNEGGGSVFTLVLQMDVAAPDEKPSIALDNREAFADHQKFVRSLRALVVDDNASNREIASRILHKAGHTMVTAASGEEAIQLFESEPFDVMLLDLFMPGTSGWVLLDRYQEQRKQGKRPPPIVVLSADANPEARDAALEKGALGYLLKPISIGKMLNILALIGSGVTRSAAPNDATTEPEADQQSLAWIDYLRSEGNPEAIIHFIETCLSGVDKAISGLRSALDANDDSQCLHHAHSLKNEFIHLAFRAGVDACRAFPDRLANGQGREAFDEIVVLATEIERHLAAEVTNSKAAISAETAIT